MHKRPDNVICFRCDAGSDIGYGHLIRCLSLANSTRPKQMCIFAMASSSEGARTMVKAAGHRLIELPADGHFDTDILLSKLGAPPDVFVLDISYDVHEENRRALKQYVGRLSEGRGLTVLIDGLNSHALVNGPGWDVDILVAPYIGAPKTLPVPHLLSGAQFVIFDDSYTASERVCFSDGPAKKVLVTFGGADTKELTLQALKALAQLEGNGFDIHVIIGPSFSLELREKIDSFVDGLKCVTLLYAPDTLADQMMWADIAVSATGLTKYELALTGTPAVLISIDETHANAHRPFEEENTALHLGVSDKVTVEAIATSVNRLSVDVELRKELFANGTRLVDSQGRTRIMDYIMRMLDD